MGNLISLLDFAHQKGIEIEWFPMQAAESLSLPLPDGSYGVAIDPDKIQSEVDEYCKIAHEVGHCATGAFYNRYSTFDIREKQEHRADRWAVQRTISCEELDQAVAEGYTELWMLADYFGVTEDFMKKAVCFYTHGNLAVDQYMNF